MSSIAALLNAVNKAEISDQKIDRFFAMRSKTEEAKKRLEALQEYQALGSGYEIALRDLEMRGAGNILGKEQSDHVNALGLNLYCQILADAVKKHRRIT